MHKIPTTEETYQKIRHTSLKILRQEDIPSDEWQNLFHIVSETCLWNEDDEQIYEMLKEEITSTVQLMLTQTSTHSDEFFIKGYIDAWKKMSDQSVYLALPFNRLKNYNTWDTANNEYNIVDLVKDTWNETISKRFQKRVRKGLSELIEADRNGGVCHPWLVAGVRDSYINMCTIPLAKLTVYSEYFEKFYLEETRSFYQINASEYMELNGVFNYLKYADLKLVEEEGRAVKYLDASSRQELSKVCADVLVTPFLEAILAECTGMIERNEVEHLFRMYRLLDLVGLARVLDVFEEHVVSVGLTDMAAANIVHDSEKYVQRLLDLYDKFSGLVKEAFRNDPRFLTRRDKAFKRIVADVSIFKLELSARKRTPAESKCPELLANFCDLLLRKTQLSKKLAPEDVESKLKGVLLLLKYVRNKDVFMMYYKSHLASRLIFDTSADSDAEENMFVWLKNAGMPAEYVSKVTQMFLDIKLSPSIDQLFKKQSNHGSIDIKILNSVTWARHSCAVSLPAELEDYVCAMEGFYKKQYVGRKLVWHHQMSNGTVTFANAVGKFDLDVSTFQMAVLFVWNERPNERISFEDLQLATELPDSELRKTVWSLVSMPMAKRKVVKCQPEVKSAAELSNETEFWINDEFALIRNGKVQRRGKINLIGRLQLSNEMCERDNEAIVYLRELRLEEAIIRVAKARKSIGSDELQNELVGILKNMFVPTKRMIKERVEVLIAREFLGRDKENFNTLFYIG